LKLKQLYEVAVKFGKDADPRGKKTVEAELKRIKKEFDSLESKDKKYFDKDRLWNPYNDTRVLYGDSQLNVSHILVGIDIEGQELLLADCLKNKGKKIDLAMAHHPEGKALATFYEVMDMQSDILSKFGVTVNVAESLMDSRKKEVARKVLPGNHTRSVDFAKALNIPFMCAHTAADNHVVSFLQSGIDKLKPQKVSDILNFLNKISEYEYARELGVGPKVIAGGSNRKCGKVFVDMTGGTEGSKKIFKKLSQAGIGTVVGMHFSEEHFKEAKKEHVNMIIAGHIASDNLGMNLLLDKLCKQDKKLNFIATSGFQRVKRG